MKSTRRSRRSPYWATVEAAAPRAQRHFRRGGNLGNIGSKMGENCPMFSNSGRCILSKIDQDGQGRFSVVTDPSAAYRWPGDQNQRQSIWEAAQGRLDLGDRQFWRAQNGRDRGVRLLACHGVDIGIERLRLGQKFAVFHGGAATRPSSGVLSGLTARGAGGSAPHSLLTNVVYGSASPFARQRAASTACRPHAQSGEERDWHARIADRG